MKAGSRTRAGWFLAAAVGVLSVLTGCGGTQGGAAPSSTTTIPQPTTAPASTSAKPDVIGFQIEVSHDFSGLPDGSVLMTTFLGVGNLICNDFETGDTAAEVYGYTRNMLGTNGIVTDDLHTRWIIDDAVHFICPSETSAYPQSQTHT